MQARGVFRAVRVFRSFQATVPELRRPSLSFHQDGRTVDRSGVPAAIYPYARVRRRLDVCVGIKNHLQRTAAYLTFHRHTWVVKVGGLEALDDLVYARISHARLRLLSGCVVGQGFFYKRLHIRGA